MSKEKIKFNTTRQAWYSIKHNWQLYLLLLPIVLWFAIWAYKPMLGLIIAFKDYESTKGIFGSDFVGFDNFLTLIVGNQATSFWQAFRNTFIISSYGLLFGFPIPIILALFFSEINCNWFRKVTQTITYLPHFLSEVTITGIVILLVYNGASTTGIIARIMIELGIVTNPEMRILETPDFFRPIYIITGIWKESGYDSIVYFAAIMGISPALYEAIRVDGGNKWQEIKYVTLPGMAPTLIIMIIMRIGKMLSVGYERVILLYNSNTYITADVLSTFEQRIGLINGQYSIGAASGIFNSLIGFALVIGANTISRQVSKTSLW